MKYMLSSSDIKLSVNSSLDKKIIKSAFSNVLVSSLLLVIVIMIISKLCSTVPAILYTYIAVLAFSLVNANYIRKEYNSQKLGAMDQDFGSMTANAATPDKKPISEVTPEEMLHEILYS
jgi:c-di-AMP phosphodiesterase-like protein